MKKVLIVDDNENYRKMLKTYLEKKNYNVHEVENAVIGCDKCFEHNYDLVIVDLFLPEKDGVQAIHELKEEFSSDIKIIAISGAAASDGITKHVLNRSLEQGADFIYNKTDDIEILLNQVNALCS